MSRRYGSPSESPPRDEAYDGQHFSQHFRHYDSPTRQPRQQQATSPSTRLLEQSEEPAPRYNPQSQSRGRYAGSPTRPGAHPDSGFNRLQAERRHSRGDIYGEEAQSPPAPPAHRAVSQNNPASESLPLHTTPGADDFSEAAAGGIAGVAYSVAEHNPRESGLAAMNNPHYPQQAYQGREQQYQQPQREYHAPSQQRQQESYAHQQTQAQGQDYGRQDRYDGPRGGAGGYEQHGYDQQRPGLYPAPYPSYEADRVSHSSSQGLNHAAIPMGAASPGWDPRDPRSRSPYRQQPTGPYTDDPYQGYTVNQHPQMGMVNPNEIDDDGDEGLEYGNRRYRNSMLSLGNLSNRSGNVAAPAAAAAGAVGGAAAGAGATRAGRDGNGQYSSVTNGAGNEYNGAAGSHEFGQEKSEWLQKQGKSSTKWKWLIGIGVLALVGAGVGLGVYFGIVKKNNSGGTGQSAAQDSSANGDLSISSAAVQALLNNKNLHKVFPGIDYTPINTQYPDCLANPPSQNNVTRDMAVLSQLTNTIRLYGTDCNQTEMTIHALRQLKLDSTVKIWLGVWQDGNATTNARQLSQMWDILDTYGASPFKGVIIANEILFRQQMTATQLGSLMASVRANITSKGMNLPVATSDLGDNWTADLAQQSDYIMSNIHPFFGGINAKDAASWTWSFWQNHDQGFMKSDPSKNVIAETGWPSQGGTDCGSDTVTNCPDAAVAGIDQMNQFMSDWVCQALANGTQYFWFESFDEPWKISFDTPGQAWEDHWGLMDVDRNLKDGVKVPDCGGKTVD